MIFFPHPFASDYRNFDARMLFLRAESQEKSPERRPLLWDRSRCRRGCLEKLGIVLRFYPAASQQFHQDENQNENQNLPSSPIPNLNQASLSLIAVRSSSFSCYPA